MTSRFGKTYSRKGGEGPSKFDEVVSIKRGTLSTKWGDTTYKARVGSKRAGAPKGALAPAAHKRARVGGDGSDDPFGFDSDEESKPVSSRGGGKSSSSKAEPPRAEKWRVSPDSRTWSSYHEGLGASARETARSGRTGPLLAKGKVECSSPSSEKRHSYAWYQNASESDKKPLAQTATLKTLTEAESAYGSWDALTGFRPPSPSREPRSPALSWTSAADELPSPPRLRSPPDVDLGFETADCGRTSTSPLLRNANCRTYRGPGKPSSSKDPDCDVPPSGPLASAIRCSGTRDYTVLHPSSASVCNVTNRAGGGEEFKGEAPPTSGAGGANSSGAAERPDATWQRKKAEQRLASQNQSRSKKGPETDLFGFEQVDGLRDDEDGDEGSDGSSRYKIKYFGFDDMSDSDGDDDDDDCEPKVRMRVKMAEETPAVAAEDSHDDPFEDGRVLQRRNAQPSQNDPERPKESTHQISDGAPADAPNFSEDAAPRKPPRGKTADTHRRIFSAQKKSPTKAVYNARHWTLESEEEPIPSFMCRPSATPAPRPSGGGTSAVVPSDVQKDDVVFKAPPAPPKVTKCVSVPSDPYQDTVTALKCRKEHKELYTVVQHVKHFNDVVEFGENQEFTDDFEYLAAGLKSGQPLNTRCLSVISLATRCAMPGFRMHLRARGKVAQVFKTLNDASQHPNLAMCTASLMYILSRDRLNMDLDRSCLDLMIRLLELDQDQGGGGGGGSAAAAESPSQLSAREICKMKEKIRKLCDTVHNKHLDLQNITTGHLAMETLLSLTSKRAGDWFKEELRLLGGLDHIVDKVKECVDNLKQEDDDDDDEDKLVSSLWGAERCLRVLDSVTVHNAENQSYLIAYKDSSLIVSCAQALRRCEEMIQRHGTEGSGAVVAKAVENCMRAVIGVLLNLTHDNEWGSTKTGEQDDLIATALNCVLRVPQYFPQEKRFDIRVLGLGLLINLVEYSARNRFCLMEMKLEGDRGPHDTTALLVAPPQRDVVAGDGPLSAVAALVQLFLQRERAAVLAEAQTDDLIKEPAKPADKSGEWRETGGEIQWVANDDAKEEERKDKKEGEEEDGELDLNKALQHAGKHMEDSIVASYTALLLGCLCQGSNMNVTTVRENLPQGDFSIMTDMLKKFLNFMNLTCDVGTAGQKSIARVIDYLDHC
ncbi:wings apart-like protein homolog isoform X2 [Syngnathoides biaculeatus]|uniref:wings apart-like protein homolog isoform X2 n=1 Tax=Syngnathoides biaculeatus TaxID=300417 RepID=UPI002ADE952D|nr:wings apart-like protein homolog isoform X2 [Syngnathoides biaculeatus]